MILCKVKNVTTSRLVILAVRDRDGQPFSFEPGECKQMMPTTVNHPAVSVHIGRGLQLVEEHEMPKTKVLEPAVSPAPPPAPKVEAPAVEPVVEAPVIQEAPATPVGNPFAQAPGMTEENAPAIVAAYPTIADLANANRDALAKCGLSKSNAKKLIAWAAAELGGETASEERDAE